jgi:2-polyprenyl-3-methyl-5-hydroxy-6-metoxy-1,4-benzoquinol methylase
MGSTILSSPFFYDAFQRIMGAGKVRQELVNQFVHPYTGCRILDMGCGTAEILSYLPKSVKYWGYDISQQYITAAKLKYGVRGQFHCGVVLETTLSNLPKFDRILALGVLHHLDDYEAKNFFVLAKKALEPNGIVVTIDPCLHDEQSPIARYLILNDRGQNIRGAESYSLLAQDSFSKVKGTLRHRNWIPYTHWIMECRK